MELETHFTEETCEKAGSSTKKRTEKANSDSETPQKKRKKEKFDGYFSDITSKKRNRDAFSQEFVPSKASSTPKKKKQRHSDGFTNEFVTSNTNGLIKTKASEISHAFAFPFVPLFGEIKTSQSSDEVGDNVTKRNKKEMEKSLHTSIDLGLCQIKNNDSFDEGSEEKRKKKKQILEQTKNEVFSENSFTESQKNVEENRRSLKYSVSTDSSIHEGLNMTDIEENYELSKKKKKRKSLEHLNEENVTTDCSFSSKSLGCDRKKKKKNKESEDIEERFDWEKLFNESCISTDYSIDENNVTNGAEVVISNENMKKKKKHKNREIEESKKKCDVIESNYENLIENDENLELSGIETEKVEKKKHKNKENVEESESSQKLDVIESHDLENLLENCINSELSKIEKERKKKHKNRETEESESSQRKSKKKKSERNHDENLIQNSENLELSGIEIEKDKKKKHKNREIEESNISQKKKKKSDVTESNENENNENSGIKTEKVKKKKHKNREIEESETSHKKVKKEDSDVAGKYHEYENLTQNSESFELSGIKTEKKRHKKKKMLENPSKINELKKIFSERTSCDNSLLKNSSKDDEIFFDDILESEKDKRRKVFDDKWQILKNLSVTLPWPVCPLHMIESRLIGLPNKIQRHKIESLNIELKNGKFSNAEDIQIKKNWRKFCLIHDLDKDEVVTLFVNFASPDGTIVIPQPERVNFARFLAHDLDNRLISSVYKRFRRMFGNSIKNSGRYSQKEDDMIIKYFSTTQSATPYADIAKVLNRDKLSVEKRCVMLKERIEGNSQKIKWNTKRIEEFMKHFVEVLNIGAVEELKTRIATTEEWREMSERLNIRIEKLRNAWSCTIYPKLFAEGKNLCTSGAKNCLFKLLIKRGETDRRAINWNEIAQEVAKEYEGFTARKLLKMFNHTLHQYLPGEKNFKRCLEFFEKLFKERELTGREIKKLQIVDNRP